MKYRVLSGVVCLVGCAFAQQLKEGEFEPYNLAVKDLNAGEFAKARQDLDLWKDKFPTSEFANMRTAFYVQAYAGLNDPARALDAAGPLLSRDLKATFPAPAGQAIVIRLLYNATWAIAHSANPTPDELAAGEKAARLLMAYDESLPGVSAEKWAEARADMKDKASGALLYIAMLPGIQAMAKHPPDCVAAENTYSTALSTYPDKTALSYELGRALNCQSKIPAAIYEFERAAVLDATLGNPANDPKKTRAFADNAYAKFHGSDEGLDQLKDQVKQSALPPQDFSIASADEVEALRVKTFEKEHPQIALWRTIRESLAGPEGVQFFETQLKGAAVPLLRGTLTEAKPACRPRELYVSIEGKPEILLRLAKPLTGKPELNDEIQWEGVGASFTPQPLQLTMDSTAEQVQGIRLTPCSATRK
jgi:hypothetical protein